MSKDTCLEIKLIPRQDPLRNVKIPPGAFLKIGIIII